MCESEMFRTAKGFNTDYFKIGQLIKVTVRNFQGQLLEIDYGFIKYISFNRIVFTYIETDRELKEREIASTDLCQNEIDISIEIVADKAKRIGV